MALFGSLVVGVSQASASESSEAKVEFTEQMATEFAQEFATTVCEGDSVSVGSIVKFYNEDGQAVGYSIDYVLDTGDPAGYVVFDVDCPNLIAEYSFDASAVSPLTKLCEVQTLSRSTDSLKPLRTSPFVYALEDIETQMTVDMYGNIEHMTDLDDSTASTPVTPSWDMIFFDGAGSFQYNIVSTNHFADFMSFDESWVESTTGRYACGVSALLNLAAANDLGYSFNWSDWGAEYIALWNATNTLVDHVQGGITYGYNHDADLGPGYASYCAARGKSLSYSLTNSPAYSQFVASVDRSRSSVFAARLKTSSSGTLEGHYLAVQGYATLQKANTTSDFLYSLIVADGWNGYARYLNFYFADYYNTAGIFFS